MKNYIQTKKHIIHREEKDGLHILFCPKTGGMLILNSSAIFIWDQCKRKVSEDNIESIIKEKFDKIKSTNLKSVINETLERLTLAGFLKSIN